MLLIVGELMLQDVIVRFMTEIHKLGCRKKKDTQERKVHKIRLMVLHQIYPFLVVIAADTSLGNH